MMLTASEYTACLRRDFFTFLHRSFYDLNPHTPFLPNWHIEVMAAKLEACRLGHCRRLIINVPPVTSSPIAPPSRSTPGCSDITRRRRSSM